MCDVIRPIPRAVTNVITEIPVRVARLLRRPLRITKAASKNTGIETTVPVNAKPAGDFLVPNSFSREPAIFSTAPEAPRN
ncbi:hypothetical protein D3C80_1881080 [compost metagenome]